MCIYFKMSSFIGYSTLVNWNITWNTFKQVESYILVITPSKDTLIGTDL